MQGCVQNSGALKLQLLFKYSAVLFFTVYCPLTTRRCRTLSLARQRSGANTASAEAAAASSSSPWGQQGRPPSQACLAAEGLQQKAGMATHSSQSWSLLHLPQWRQHALAGKADGDAELRARQREARRAMLQGGDGGSSGSAGATASAAGAVCDAMGDDSS
jgi:hypothetical protein